jgi:hypothetical protein
MNRDTTWLGKTSLPVVVPLLNGRFRALVFAVAGSVQVAAAMCHLPGMPCPFVHLFHVPCPGCGISRASAATLRADFGSAVRLHAFAPFFLFAIILCWAAAVLPEKHRVRLIESVGRLEYRTALPTLLLIAAIFYWAMRFLYAPGQMAVLSSG